MSRRPGDWGYEGDDDDEDSGPRREKVALLIDVDVDRARALAQVFSHTLVHTADAVRALDIIRALKPDLVVVAVDHPGGALELLTTDRDAASIPRVVLAPAWRAEEVRDLCAAVAPFDAADAAGAKAIAGAIEAPLLQTPPRAPTPSLKLDEAHRVLQGVTRFDGSIHIEDHELTRLVLPDLREVAGCLVIDANRLQSLALPQLEHVGLAFTIRCRELRLIDLPRLTTSRCLWVSLSAVERVHAPRLVETWGPVWFDHTPKLVHVELPALRRVGKRGLWLWHQPIRDKRWLAMQRLSLPHLVEIGDGLRLQHLHGLKELSLPSLERVGGGFNVEATALAALRAPRLHTIGGEAYVVGNRALDSIEMPSLTRPPTSVVMRNNRGALWPTHSS